MKYHHHRGPGEGNGTPLQYSCLENPMDGGTWWAAVHGVAKSQAWLSNFTFTFHFHALEKEMATHSSILAWRIPGTEEPSGLPSIWSHRIGHDWSDLAVAAAAGALESPLDCKEIEPGNPKGNQPWISIGRTDAEAEAPILQPTDAKSQLTGKDPDAGKDWGQEEEGATEDETVGGHHWLNRHEFEPTLGNSEGQGSLVCCSAWGCKGEGSPGEGEEKQLKMGWPYVLIF